MAVTQVREHWPGRDSDVTENEVSVDRFFHVYTDNKNDTQLTIIQSGMVPLPRSAHPSSAGLLCNKLGIKQDAACPTHWFVTASYSNQPLPQNEKEENPLNQPAKITWDPVEFERPTIFDKDDKPYLNSAKESYDPQMVDDARKVAKVEKNIAADLPAWWISFPEVFLNETAVLIDGQTIPAKKGKFKNFRAGERQIQAGTAFRVLSYEIHYKKDGWKRKLLDEGYMRLVDFGGPQREQYPITLKGQRPTKPVRLDGGGEIQENPTADNAVVNEFDDYPEVEVNGVLPLA